MGTEVLRPQDYFAERVREAPSCRRKSYYYGNYQHAPSSASPTPNPRPSGRKQPPVQKKTAISKRSASVDDVPKFVRSSHHRSASSSSVNHLAMEKVTILRRGESLDSKIKGAEERKEPAADMIVTGTSRIGPDTPAMAPKQIGIVDLRSPVPRSPIYAGSACAVSPAPSSLPLPSFSKKKQISFDDSATRDLRRLLRLEF